MGCCQSNEKDAMADLHTAEIKMDSRGRPLGQSPPNNDGLSQSTPSTASNGLIKEVATPAEPEPTMEPEAEAGLEAVAQAAPTLAQAAPTYVPSKRPAGPSIDAQLQAAVKAQEVEGEEAEVVVKVEDEGSSKSQAVPRKSFLENMGKQVSGFFEPVAGVFSQEGEKAEVVVKVEGEGSRKSVIETLGKQVSSFLAPVVGVFSQESKEAEITVTEGSQDRAVNAGAPARSNDQ